MAFSTHITDYGLDDNQATPYREKNLYPPYGDVMGIYVGKTIGTVTNTQYNVHTYFIFTLKINARPIKGMIIYFVICLLYMLGKIDIYLI